MKEVKQETARLFRIYGAIDQRVRGNPEIAQRVSALLPAYEDPETHWADAFPNWSSELRPASDGTAGGSILKSSLDGLGPMELRCRMPARRVFAIGAAALAFREELRARDSEGRELRDSFRNALTPSGFGGGQETGELILRYFLDDSALPRTTPGTPASIAAWWRKLLKQASLEGAEGGPGIGPPPCSTGLVWVMLEDDDEPVPTFVTEFDVAMPYEQATSFCDPVRWKCFALWCNMEDREREKAKKGVVHRYRETVSLDCGRRRLTQTFRIELDFITTEYDGPPRLSVTEYRLSDHNQEERVLVNAGSLVITELSAEKVRIKTTKRLKFSDPLDGAGFASTLCHVGYMGYVEDLICCATDPNWKAAFPGEKPGLPQEPKTPTWVNPDVRGLMTYTLRRSETTLVQWLDDYEKAYKKSAKKSPAKRRKECYTGADVLDDLVDLWTVAMCEAPKLAVSAFRSARMPPRPRKPSADRAGR